MGSFIFDEIDQFARKQTAFSVHPKPISISDLTSPELNYMGTLKTMRENVVPKKLDSLKGDGAVVGLLDTGVNSEHELFKGKIIYETNYLGETVHSNQKELADTHGHGTHLAGIICAENKLIKYTEDGVAKSTTINGVAKNAKIVSVKVTDGDDGYTTWWKITDGLEQIIKYNFSIPEKDKHLRVNMVLIAYNALDNVNKNACTCHHRLQKLINQLAGMQIPVICSGGNGQYYFKTADSNSMISGLGYPAYLQNTIVAVSRDQFGKLSNFTQRVYNDGIIKLKQQFAIYGEDTVSAGIKSDSDYSVLSGSSQAAASLTGILALLYEKNTKTGLKPFLNTIVLNLLSEQCTETTENVYDTNRNPISKKYFAINK